jgi:hypothetical protein
MHSLSLNLLEIFNESCLLMCLYTCFTYSDFVSDIETRYLIGWVFLAIVMINITVNWIILMIYLMRAIINKIMSKCMKCSRKKDKIV